MTTKAVSVSTKVPMACGNCGGYVFLKIPKGEEVSRMVLKD